MELDFEIIGKVPAKSSRRRIITNRRTGKPMILSSQDCLQYERDFAAQILKGYKNKFDEKERLEIVLWVWTENYRQDIDSFPKIILDCLQKNEIIINDNRIDRMLVVREIGKPKARIKIKSCQPLNGGNISTN